MTTHDAHQGARLDGEVSRLTSIHDLYEQGRDRISQLVRQGDVSAPVPTCPGWAVRDVLAHVVGVSADVTSGNIQGAATEPWTAAQLALRADRSVDELLVEWQEVGPQLAQLLDHLGDGGHEVLFDVTTHEHDIRAALDRPGARGHESIADGIRYLTARLIGRRMDERHLPPLEIVTELGTFVAGTTDLPAARLEAPAFEIFRALLGRRSTAQISGLEWSVESGTYMDVLVDPRVTVPARDVAE